MSTPLTITTCWGDNLIYTALHTIFGTMKDVENIQCPRCGIRVLPRLHIHQSGMEPFSASTSFPCQSSYVSKWGRRRCGRPTIITHDQEHVIAIFPVRWADVQGMDLEDMVEQMGDRVQRMRVL